MAVLLAILAGGAALPLTSPAPPIILASAIVYEATFMGVPAAVTALIKANTPPAGWTATLAAFTTLFAAGRPPARGSPDSSPITPRPTRPWRGPRSCAPQRP
ncbi:YbfB/YjiJ family MFS transporter [Streptosporangium sp. NPDC000396]|uniref:YbfB/YjiJ family MFS transporter n=1 Tax=Streptosporangium sp. NPDC000396 TaxID=3366185 RepID=UPI0036CAF9D6